MNLKIVFDHPEMVVVDKPAGVLTVPSRFEDADARRVLGRELETSLKTRLFPVHRLDFEVSGLVIFAKSPGAQKDLSRFFEKRQVEKVYEAFTSTRDFSHLVSHEGKELPKSSEDIKLDPATTLEWKCKIQRGKRRSFLSLHGDFSVTRVNFIESVSSQILPEIFAEILRWQVRPLTGRPHQIRFEMSRHGFPILGDTLYGSKLSWPKDSKINDVIALRAVRLEMPESFPGVPKVFEVGGLKL